MAYSPLFLGLAVGVPVVALVWWLIFGMMFK